MRAARLAFVLISVSWIVLLLAAPTAAFGVPASALVYAFGSLICHQRPERSFHIEAAQIPVCARCLGLYAGAAVGALAAFKPWRGPLELRTILIAAAIPTAFTWGSEVAGLWAPGNLTRFIAALPFGAAVAVTVNYFECVRPRRTGHSPPRLPI